MAAAGALTSLGVGGELHVGAAALDADLAENGHRRVAQALVLLVGERLLRRDGDGVAGVHAHGVHVLDAADDDAVVRQVPHHLELVLLPAQQRLLHEHLWPHIHPQPP